MLNELKDIIVPRVLSVLGPWSKREREKKGRGESVGRTRVALSVLL